MDQKNKVPSWIDLGEHLSSKEKFLIFENYYANGVLFESDEHAVVYFNGLTKFSTIPQTGNKYIVLSLMLIQNKIYVFDDGAQVLEFVSKKDNDLLFRYPNGQVHRYPDVIIGNQGVQRSFVFDTIVLYDKFRSALAMKFNVALPNIDNLDESKIGLARIKSLTGFLLR